MVSQETTTGWWYTYPSGKWWSSSVGIMKFPSDWKNGIHVPNHQPALTIVEKTVKAIKHAPGHHSYGISTIVLVYGSASLAGSTFFTAAKQCDQWAVLSTRRSTDETCGNQSRHSTRLNLEPPTLNWAQVLFLNIWLIYGQYTDNNGSYTGIISGWWYTYPPKNMKNSWGDYSQYMEK